MSAKIDCERNGCTFIWKVVNISHGWFEKYYSLESPTFIAHAPYSSEWFLKLYPICAGNMFHIYLVRSEVCKGPLEIDIKYRIDLMDKNGESLIASNTENKIFQKGYPSSSVAFEREKTFGSERQTFLPEDTLTIQCTISRNGETLLKTKQVSARTVFNVNRKSFDWKIKEFSKNKTGVRNKFKDNFIEIDLVSNSEQCDKNELALKFIKIDTSIKYFSFIYSTQDTEGKKEYCDTQEYSQEDLKTGLLRTLNTYGVSQNKSRYLSGGVLTLDCQCVYITESAVHEYCLDGMNSSEARNVVVKKGVESPYEEEKTQPKLALVKDLKSILNNKDFSDIELRTSTKTFPTHKIILSARSPVFRRMFSNDMKENNCGHIDIHDLEEDTVQQMLLYMYTDSLEDLRFENACKLYVAADKYEILALKGLCSSSLKNTLCPTNACDILVLADRHQDENLKSAVQKFILRHDEVFGLQEWENLMAANLQLAADVMYRKLKPM